MNAKIVECHANFVITPQPGGIPDFHWAFSQKCALAPALPAFVPIHCTVPMTCFAGEACWYHYPHAPGGGGGFSG